MPDKFIITNFAYGTGPYLRTTALAAAFNDELEKREMERMKIIVPLVYGERQKRGMQEEFGEYYRDYPGELIFDEKLGEILGSVFYGNNTYEGALKKWVFSAKEVSGEARRHLKNIYGDDIAVELARSPRIRYDVAPAYFTSFAYIAEILERALGAKEINVNQKLLESGAKAADWVESVYKIHAIAYPATFDYLENRKPRYKTEISVPPIATPPFAHSGKIDRGIFVTITGIPGLERLYAEAEKMGLRLYSNDPESIYGRPPSIDRLSTSDVKQALPHIIPNQNIAFQFARSGWSSVWLSMISGTPLVVPDFDPKDDPEIYFNNLAVESLGIGVVYRGQPLEEILEKRDAVRRASSALCGAILRRWGTLDGNKYSAKLFVDDFVS